MIKPVLQTFLDKPPALDSCDYKVFSAPLDITTSYRRGTRFGPASIRRESSYMETFSHRTNLDWDDLKLADIGEVECPDIETALNSIEKTVESIDALPIMLGGEHTVTLGALRALKPDLVLVFDAHLDLRDELFGERFCHATFLRRAYEELGFSALIIGARALSREEVDFADKKEDLRWVSAKTVMEEKKAIINQVIGEIEKVNSFYLSVDMDALDPAYSPGVGNPYPEGLSTACLMDIIKESVNEKLVGLDIVEVYPGYDNGTTASTAAYIILETLYSHINK
ncbi:agmatinase, partial [Candidatus Bathyarchaeota archaeon]|nr:agmatinase [Candidatus Bathyarchaeota archaeon]